MKTKRVPAPGQTSINTKRSKMSAAEKSFQPRGKLLTRSDTPGRKWALTFQNMAWKKWNSIINPQEQTGQMGKVFSAEIRKCWRKSNRAQSHSNVVKLPVEPAHAARRLTAKAEGRHGTTFYAWFISWPFHLTLETWSLFPPGKGMQLADTMNHWLLHRN